MSRSFGIASQEIYPQPGFTARQNENGGWVGQHSFAIKRTAWDSPLVRDQFRKGTGITEIDPNVPAYFSFLAISSVEVTGEEADLIFVAVELNGANSGQYQTDGLSDSALPTYRLTCGLQDASFTEHPKWQTLSALQKTALGHVLNGTLAYDDEKGKICVVNESAATPDEFFDPFLPYDTIVTGDCLEFAKLIASGQTTYLKPTVTWTESTQGNAGLTSNQLNKIGNIATPRGNPPQPSGTRDWMLTSAFQEQRGELITTELEWTLSEEGGHNSFLYQ